MYGRYLQRNLHALVYQALDQAIAAIHEGKTGAIPNHLKDAHYAGAKELGHVGYQYPHDTPIGTFGGNFDVSV